MAGKDKATETEAPETASAEPGPISFPLRKAVDAHGEKVKVLTFREPIGGDIERFGHPVIINFQGDSVTTTIDEKKMTQMMSALAGVPPSAIRQLHPRDWTTCAYGIAPFFLPDMERL